MPKKDKMLYFMHYAREEEGLRKYNKIVHELKHFKNKNLTNNRLITEGGGKLSVEDYYKLKVEDEITAHLAKVIENINKYLKGDNLANLDMFKGKEWIIEKLKKTPIPERQDVVLDMDFIVNSTLENWNMKHRAEYEPQFASWAVETIILNTIHLVKQLKIKMNINYKNL